MRVIGNLPSFNQDFNFEQFHELCGTGKAPGMKMYVRIEVELHPFLI
jgi:hypothetical protein